MAAALRARLADVDASISELQTIRETIQRQLDAIAYPVLTLPNEVTSEIFIHCLPAVPAFSDQDKKNPSSSEAPLLLLRICRAWRAVALETPMLWVHLHLHLEDVYEDAGKIITEWLRRAGSLPLSLSVRGCVDLDPVDSDAIIATLVRHAPQLRSVALQLQQPQFREIEGAGPFPLLENLALALLSTRSQTGKLGIFQDSPRLSQLYLGQNAILSIFPIPCHGLTKVTCASLPADDLFDLLTSAPDLLDLTCSVEFDLPVHAEVIAHHRLKTLRLTDRSSTHFLSLLRLPALENLHLDIEDNLDNASFLAFISYSSASLRKFTTGVRLHTLSTEWSSIMRELTDVELSPPHQRFLWRVAYGDGSGTSLLPRLQSLELLHPDEDGVEDKLIFALFARAIARDGVAQLKSFRMIWFSAEYSPPSLPKPTRTALRTLAEGGMQIYIGTKEKNAL